MPYGCQKPEGLRKNMQKRNLIFFFLTDGTINLVGLPELTEKAKYEIACCVYEIVFIRSITFQTLWKENSLCTPLSFGNLLLSDPLLPLGISVTLCGVGMDIFCNHTLHMHTCTPVLCGQFCNICCMKYYLG